MYIEIYVKKVITEVFTLATNWNPITGDRLKKNHSILRQRSTM